MPRENKKGAMMNRQLFELQWQKVRDQTPAWWGLISTDDLKKVDTSQNKFDKYITLLQVKYGYTREQANSEICKRIAGNAASSVAHARLKSQ